MYDLNYFENLPWWSSACAYDSPSFYYRYSSLVSESRISLVRCGDRDWRNKRAPRLLTRSSLPWESIWNVFSSMLIGFLGVIILFPQSNSWLLNMQTGFRLRWQSGFHHVNPWFYWSKVLQRVYYASGHVCWIWMLEVYLASVHPAYILGMDYWICSFWSRL